MNINEHQKKGCDKAMGFKGNILELKLYPPLRNVAKGVYLAKGGNILNYRVKANALLKPRNSHLLTTLALQPIQKSEQKCKKEKTLPLEIHDKVRKDVVVHKKHFTKHGGQVVKQVSSQERILERTASPEPITHEKSQHSAIGSYLLYLNVQHCNVPLSFKKIQLAIVKCSQSINIIFSVQLKSNLY
jgi:hypothetical protein